MRIGYNNNNNMRKLIYYCEGSPFKNNDYNPTPPPSPEPPKPRLKGAKEVFEKLIKDAIKNKVVK